MLTHLHIRNMALLKEEEISFGSGLNILTGETGAGKSILIGSLNAALGISSMKDMIPDGEDTSLVELIFSSLPDTVRRKMEEMDIPIEEDQIIISRRFKNGKSISRINGETVPVKRVREISSLLIDIHGQNEHQSLLQPSSHRQFLDRFDRERSQKLLQECRRAYEAWQKAEKAWQEASLDESERMKKIDLLTYEWNEIEEAGLKIGEDEELEAEYARMANAQQILEAVSACDQFLGQGGGAAEMVGRSLKSLGSVSSLDPALSSLFDQLSLAEDMLGDFSRSLRDYMDGFTYDEETYYRTSSRLDLLNRLKHKYGGTLEKVLAYQAERREELDRLEDYAAWLDQLEKDRRTSYAALEKAAASLGKVRRENAPVLQNQIARALRDLNFPDVRFEIRLEDLEKIQEHGKDSVVFYISTNPGVPLKPLQEVASGGEMSRIMLAMKAVMAGQDEIDTLIFDEIDAGISGRTAQKVSEKMALIAAAHQVICITHLAQIAAMADSHFEIIKTASDQSTRTRVRPLNEEERIGELERILGGVSITKAVEENAREMKRQADAQKNQIRQNRTEEKR